MDQINELKKAFDKMQIEVNKAIDSLPESVSSKKSELLNDLSVIQAMVKNRDEDGLNKLAKKYAGNSSK